jgi:AcrR family transcriptional regulator
VGAVSVRADGVDLARGGVPEIQRARILAALVEVARERGAGGVTVAHVVTRSGVSRRTFYEMFEDRDACFLAAFRDAVQRTAARVVPAFKDSRPSDANGNRSRADHASGAGRGAPRVWRERVRAGLLALLEFLDDEPGLGGLCVVDALGADPATLHERARVVSLLVDAVDEGRLEVKAGLSPSRLTAEGVVGGVLAVLYTRLAASGPRLASGPAPASGSMSSESASVRAAGRSPGGNRSRGGGPSRCGEGSRSGNRSRGRDRSEPLVGLLSSLMGIVVLPYLGPAAAAREAARAAPRARPRAAPARSNPLEGLEMRLTYRTVRVLAAIASEPDASNRQVAIAAEVQDQGQISKLLARLAHLGLIENASTGLVHGEPNAWRLTSRGQEVNGAIRCADVKRARKSSDTPR